MTNIIIVLYLSNEADDHRKTATMRTNIRVNRKMIIKVKLIALVLLLFMSILAWFRYHRRKKRVSIE